MSGTIVFGPEVDWFVKSGLFNWVVPFLRDRVQDPATRDELALIDEQNFKWLDLRELSDAGRAEVLALLANELVPFAELHFPDTQWKAANVDLMRELAALARRAVAA